MIRTHVVSYGVFATVSLHVQILIKIKTYHSKGQAPSFKTQDLSAFQNQTQKSKLRLATKPTILKLNKNIPFLLVKRIWKSLVLLTLNFVVSFCETSNKKSELYPKIIS